MIEFYKDNLVPPELCRLLYQVAPKKYHVPVRFHNRRKKDVHGYRGRLPLGTLNTKHGKEPLHIDINLNPIYGSLGWRKVDSPEPIAPSSAIWRLLLEVCLHEFGHVATNQAALKMNYHEYHAKYGHGRVYKFTEQLADDWRDCQIERILRIDSRLGQPLYITGYFGARLLRWREWAKDWPGCYPYIMERRCQRTGGQLTTGDVLRRLSINPRSYTNAYALLRRASEGLGIDYVDRAGRRHKLYRWGAVPLLAQRFDRSELRKSKRGQRGEHERYDVSAGYHPGEIEVQKRAGVRSMAERAEEIPKGGLVMAGSVQSIFYAPEGGAKMQSVQAATALEGCGLEGDRYCAGTGHWSRFGKVCEVTFIAAEDLDDIERETGLGVKNGEHRRNVVTSGISLKAFRRGKRFRVGEVAFEYRGPRSVCRYIERLTEPGMTQALKGRGGICARVIETGTVRVGDEIEVLQPTEERA